MNERLVLEDFVKPDVFAHIADLILKQNEFTTAHSHNFFEVFVVEKGTFIHDCNGEKTILTKGMGKFIKPKDNHKFIASGKYETNILRNIAISPKIFKQILKIGNIKLTKSFFDEFVLDEHLLYQFSYKTNKFMEEYDSSYKNFLVQSVLSDLIVYIIDSYSFNKNIPKWLQELYQVMQEDENLVEGLPRLIKLSNRTQEHVTREFSKYYGITPTDFINEIRLKKSAKLLLQTDMLIIAISDKCGFNTLTYYNKLFKKYYGCSPSEYRKRNRKIFF